MNTIAQEIDTLHAMTPAELVERYVAVFGHAPRCKQPTWLLRRIAWRIQEQRLGGLSETAKARLEELIAEIDIPLEPPARSARTTLGTTVRREWRGRVVCATAVAGGWEHDGVVYRSLSAIAKRITGGHLSGPAFFHLSKRKGAS